LENGPIQKDTEPRNVQRGLMVESRLVREQRRGYESSPNTSEFSDLNDLSNAQNVFHERELRKIQEIVERYPQILRVVEDRVRGNGGGRTNTKKGQLCKRH
jgi:hypothetical protein